MISQNSIDILLLSNLQETFQSLWTQIDYYAILMLGLEVLRKTAILGTNLLSYFLTVRYSLAWFPGINPFTQPLFGLNYMCDLYVDLFRGLTPSILGIDTTAMTAFTILEFMRTILKTITLTYEP